MEADMKHRLIPAGLSNLREGSVQERVVRCRSPPSRDVEEKEELKRA